jgi:hypothetical protein
MAVFRYVEVVRKAFPLFFLFFKLELFLFPRRFLAALIIVILCTASHHLFSSILSAFLVSSGVLLLRDVLTLLRA